MKSVMIKENAYNSNYLHPDSSFDKIFKPKGRERPKTALLNRSRYTDPSGHSINLVTG